MRKKLRFFKQHTLETCGASCMLMLLDLYGRVQYPTEKQERKLYGLYRSRAFKGISAAAIANCLSRNGLHVTLLHSSDSMMDNRDGYFDEELFRRLLDEYRQELEKCAGRIHMVTGAQITCRSLSTALEEGNQVILECIIPGDADGIHQEVLHWIVLYGLDGDDFLACDPLSGKIRLAEAELEKYMDTPIGKICVAVREESPKTSTGGTECSVY